MAITSVPSYGDHPAKNDNQQQIKTSDLFVRSLEAEGVEFCFAIPGEENLDILESLRTSKIQLVVCRHEQAAGFMAATVGRLTGKTGVCLATLGPGATNFVTAAAYGQLGAFPMLMITGQKPIRHSKQGAFQIVDVVSMMAALTKYAKQLVSGFQVPSLVRESFRIAEEERPGAVHLELPEDIAAEMIPGSVRPFTAEKIRRPAGEDKAIKIAVEMIEKATKPLLLIGAGANRKLASNMLTQLVDETGIPFFVTQMGKGVVNDDHPLCLGTAALSDHDFVHMSVAEADLIINVGHDVVEKPPFFMHQGEKRKVIHVNFTSAQVDQVYFPQHEVVGDIGNSVWQIKQSIRKQVHWDFSYFMKQKAALDRHLARDSTDERFPMIPQRIIKDLRDIMPDDGIVCLDNGMYKVWFARYYRARERNTLLLDNALATMGAGLPSAMAAKMVFPNRKVVAVTGDGGFMMNAQELETAVRLKQHLVVIIINDNAYGMIKWKQHDGGFEDWGLDLDNPDFVKFAEAHGAHGHRITSVSDFTSTISKCLNEAGVHLVDCPVDYSENIKVLSEELKNIHIE
eukprot:Clim_evm71s108 gene=Clim_evmTU71s108